MKITKTFFLIFITQMLLSCTDYDPNYNYEASCQKEKSPYGVWEAKRIGAHSRSELLSNGTANVLYRIEIRRNNTYTYCDDKNCTQNTIQDQGVNPETEGAFLKGFLDDPVTKPFIKLTQEDIGTRLTGSYLDFRDMSCMNERNQYCENKQCRFFGDFESVNKFVFVKVKNY